MIAGLDYRKFPTLAKKGKGEVMSMIFATIHHDRQKGFQVQAQVLQHSDVFTVNKNKNVRHQIQRYWGAIFESGY